MACGSPECVKAEKRKWQINNARHHAKVYAKAHNLDKMSIVETVNGSISWTTTDDARIGKQWTEIDVIIL